MRNKTAGGSTEGYKGVAMQKAAAGVRLLGHSWWQAAKENQEQVGAGAQGSIFRKLQLILVIHSTSAAVRDAECRLGSDRENERREG